MAEITVHIEEGEEIKVPVGSPLKDALSQLLSNKQRKQVVAAFVGDTIIDLNTPLTTDSEIKPITKNSDEGLEVLRHSTAHIMAKAVRDIFGKDVKVAIGPAIENGFYYDFLRDEPFSPDDFAAIEERMSEIVKTRAEFTRQEIPFAEAKARFEQEDEKYKLELIEDLEGEQISIYQVDDFVDLCRGPHLPDTTLLISP